MLDNTAVHPESYDAARKILEFFKADLKAAKADKLGGLKKEIDGYGWEKAAAAAGVGVPTLEDIVKELAKPGRDLRDELPPPMLRTDVMDIDDLKEGMKITGTVRNVIDFGAFVDIGVHQDGLVHISQISDNFIKHPSEALSVGEVVKVKIIGVDKAKNRISLTMKTGVSSDKNASGGKTGSVPGAGIRTGGENSGARIKEEGMAASDFKAREKRAQDSCQRSYFDNSKKPERKPMESERSVDDALKALMEKYKRK